MPGLVAARTRLERAVGELQANLHHQDCAVTHMAECRGLEKQRVAAEDAKMIVEFVEKLAGAAPDRQEGVVCSVATEESHQAHVRGIRRMYESQTGMPCPVSGAGLPTQLWYACGIGDNCLQKGSGVGGGRRRMHRNRRSSCTAA